MDAITSHAAPVITACAAIAAAFSAYFSFCSSRTAESVAAITLVERFRGHYASDEMFTDLRNLRAWYDKFGSKFAETWQEKLKQNDEDLFLCDRRLS
jgi:hypothetical protein